VRWRSFIIPPFFRVDRYLLTSIPMPALSMRVTSFRSSRILRRSSAMSLFT